MLVWLGLILLGGLVLRGIYFDKTIISPFAPTPTPTRTIFSYEQEGDTYFKIGKLNEAIRAYKDATGLKPNDPGLWSKLARIQVYSSELLTTDEEILQRRRDALASIEKAVQLDPESSQVHGIKAFVLDWLSNTKLIQKEEAREYLFEAESEATRAITLDPRNPQAIAFAAEILVDQGQWLRAQQTIQQAVEQAPDEMDVRRVNAYVLESLGEYQAAIDEYIAAAEITPNLTFLYIYIGRIYRTMWQRAATPEEGNQYFAQTLEYFEKAVTINSQIGIKDPIPYLAIGSTYSQHGDFMIAVINVRKGVNLNPTSADVYARLGLVYHQSRNYEGAIEAFKCALEGCAPEESCKVRRDCDEDVQQNITITGLPLTDTTVVYYYTYGSVLAALSKPSNTNCVTAAKVFDTIRGGYESDDFVMRIVNVGESICAAQPPSRVTSTPASPAASPPAAAASTPSPSPQP